jgi:hypothetical protein
VVPTTLEALGEVAGVLEKLMSARSVLLLWGTCCVDFLLKCRGHEQVVENLFGETQRCSYLVRRDFADNMSREVADDPRLVR